MPNLTIDLLPANTAPVATDILHSRTVGGVDEYLSLTNLLKFMLGQDSTKVVSVDYDTLTTSGVYRNTFATHSPDSTAVEYVVQVLAYTANAVQVMQIAMNVAGSIFIRTQNNSNVWTAWKSYSSRGYDDSVVKNLSASVDWRTIVNSGLYYIPAGGTQTNSPDASTDKAWFVNVNTKGGDTTYTSIIAVRQDTNRAYNGMQIGGTWSAWKVTGNPRTGTLVVAASNSSVLSKDSADFICDGTADDVQIQAAITYLAAGGTYGLGGTVVLTEGTFNIATNILVKSNVHLKGQGPATILLNNGTPDQLISIATGVINYVLQDFNLNGNGESYGIICDDYTTNTNSHYINIHSYGNVAGGAGMGFLRCVNLIDCSTAGNTFGFYDCWNLTNCIGHDGTDFINCRKLTSCTSETTGNGAPFSNCNTLTNCSSILSTAAYVFNSCAQLLNCIGKSTYAGGSVVFYACNRLSNCIGEATVGVGFQSCNDVFSCHGTGSIYGFYACYHMLLNTAVKTNVGGSPTPYGYKDCTVTSLTTSPAVAINNGTNNDTAALGWNTGTGN